MGGRKTDFSGFKALKQILRKVRPEGITWFVEQYLRNRDPQASECRFLLRVLAYHEQRAASKSAHVNA